MVAIGPLTVPPHPLPYPPPEQPALVIQLKVVPEIAYKVFHPKHVALKITLIEHRNMQQREHHKLAQPKHSET